jgi:hypothetical protein
VPQNLLCTAVLEVVDRMVLLAYHTVEYFQVLLLAEVTAHRRCQLSVKVHTNEREQGLLVTTLEPCLSHSVTKPRHSQRGTQKGLGKVCSGTVLSAHPVQACQHNTNWPSCVTSLLEKERKVVTELSLPGTRLPKTTSCQQVHVPMQLSLKRCVRSRNALGPWPA